MSKLILLRWSGIACVLCGLLLPVPWIMDIIIGLPPSLMSMTIDFVAIACIIFALMGIYGVQIEESGVFGFLGFVFTILMSCIGLTVITWSPQSPDIEESAVVLVLLMGLLGLLGYTLLCIGSWKANIFPRWIVVLWPIGTLISALGVTTEYLHVIGICVWGLGFISAGVVLLKGLDKPAVYSKS